GRERAALPEYVRQQPHLQRAARRHQRRWHRPGNLRGLHLGRQSAVEEWQMVRVRLGIALAVVLAGTGLATATHMHAQQPTTVVPGQAVIWTDRAEYSIGDPIQYCYRVPLHGRVTITDLPADGSSRVIFDRSGLSTQDCLEGTVTPPPGRECLRLTYPLVGGQGQTQTCFTVLGGAPPPPSLAIYLSGTSCRVGAPSDLYYV